MADKRVPLLFVAAIAAIAALRLYITPVTDANHYPLVFVPDTWEWISQALRMIGEDTDNPGRPPLLAIIFALLYRLGLDNYLGVALQLLALCGAIPVFLIADRLFDRTTAFLSVLVMLLNRHYFAASYYLSADVLCVILTAAALACTLLTSRTAAVFGWIFAGLAYYAHNAPPIFAVYLAWLLIQQGPRFYRNRTHILGLTIFSVLALVYGFIFFDYSISHYRNLSVLGFNGMSLFLPYLIHIAYSLGLACSVFALYGFVRATTERAGWKPLLLLLIWLMPFMLFFALFYTWFMSRLILYFCLPLILLASRGLRIAIAHFKQPASAVLVTAVLLSANASGPDVVNYEPRDMVLFPGLVHGSNGIAKASTTLAVWHFLANEPGELLKQGFQGNIFPDDVVKTAAVLSRHMTDREDYFSVMPLNARIRARFCERLHVLSRKRYVATSAENLYDPKRKAFVILDLPNRRIENPGDLAIINMPYDEAAHTLTLDYIARSGRFSLIARNGIFKVYLRI